MTDINISPPACIITFGTKEKKKTPRKPSLKRLARVAKENNVSVSINGITVAPVSEAPKTETPSLFSEALKNLKRAGK
jgi:hypothetical protein